VNDDYRYTIKRFHRLNIIHRFHIHRIAENTGLYFGQPPILLFIAENDGCTQKELAEKLGVSTPSIATSVKRLERKGMIKKSEDEKDRRYCRLSTTETGSRLCQDYKRLCHDMEELMFQDFSKAECEQLSGYLERLTTNLSTQEILNKTNFAIIEEDKKIKSMRKEKEKYD